MPRGQGRQGLLSKGISGVIGFGTEAYAHHQESQQAQHQPQQLAPVTKTTHESLDHPQDSPSAPPPYESQNSDHTDASSTDDDEEDWIRDETETQLKAHTADSHPDQSIDGIIGAFVKQHPPPSYASAVGHLPCSVIIPQRRPQTKSRGFVRAYAPVLNDCGIDEKTFMDFHEGFHKATNKEGWFMAINIAIAISVIAETAAVAPSVIVHATAFCVHASIEAGRRLYVTHETNKFLESMNEKLFKPHGLYAMIMTYKPDSSQASEVIDINQNITSAVYARTGGSRSKFRSASGKTQGAAQMPEAAPLVFPILRDAPEAEKVNAFKRAANFAADYSDRRAQASFESQNPDTHQLTAGPPRKEFASRWADPNHPVNQGGLLNTLSGGVINPTTRRQQRREYRSATTGRPSRINQHSQQGGLVSSARRAVKENVLYLMVVNMPSEHELRAAGELMAKVKAGGFGDQLAAMLSR